MSSKCGDKTSFSYNQCLGCKNIICTQLPCLACVNNLVNLYKTDRTMRSILSIKSHHSEKLIFFDGFCRWMEEMVLAKLLSHFSRVRLCDPIDGSPLGLPHPWDYPGKNTGVGCHFLLQCMEVKSESEVVQLCPTLSDPMGCSLPGSSIHGIFQARVLERGAIAFSGNSTTLCY